MLQKNNDMLIVNKTQSAFTKAYAETPFTYREDGHLEMGDHIMIRNAATCGALVCDTHDKILGALDEAYAVTSCGKPIGAQARSIFVVERADPKDGCPDNCVHFGQQVRLATNGNLLNRPLYLSSTAITP